MSGTYHTFFSSLLNVSVVNGKLKLLFISRLRINVKAARAVRRRFVDHFGPLNQHFSMYGHDFVILDAPGLVEEDYHRSEQGVGFANLTASPGGTMEFVQQLTDSTYLPHSFSR